MKLFASMGTIALILAACATEANAGSLTEGTYYGAGNSNTNWTVVNGTGTSANVETALRAKIRGSNVDVPVVGNTYFVDLGADPAAPTRALWNWDFSVYTGAKSLSSYSALITISDNLGSTPVSFNPLAIGDNATTTFGSVSNPLAVTGMQNSENATFSSIFVSPFNFNTAAIYKITLDVSGPGIGSGLTPSPLSNTIYVNASADPAGAAAAVPVPAAAYAGFSMLGGLGFFGWRRRRKAN